MVGYNTLARRLHPWRSRSQIQSQNHKCIDEPTADIQGIGGDDEENHEVVALEIAEVVVES